MFPSTLSLWLGKGVVHFKRYLGFYGDDFDKQGLVLKLKNYHFGLEGSQVPSSSFKGALGS